MRFLLKNRLQPNGHLYTSLQCKNVSEKPSVKQQLTHEHSTLITKEVSCIEH